MMNDDPEERIDPMARIFPRVTKCTFKKFGPGGGLMPRDALCVLPVNIVNEVRELIAKCVSKEFCCFVENLCFSLVLADHLARSDRFYDATRILD